MRKRPGSKIIIPAVVVGLLVVFVLAGSLSSNDRLSVSHVRQPDATESVASSEGGESSAPGQDAGAASSAKDPGVQGIVAAVSPAPTTSPHHLVRTGDLSLLLTRGTLMGVVDRITLMTKSLNGYVVSSSVGSEPVSAAAVDAKSLGTDTARGGGAEASSSAPVTDDYATLTLRVPENDFDAAVRRFSSLGDVQSVSTSSEDVTSQFVDLRARLHHYRAVERRLVRFLASTGSIGQMLAVQDRIDRVQMTIEQLTAQLRSMRDTTVYGTLSVYLREKGVPQAGAIDPSDTFTGTLRHSLMLLARGARVTGLVATALLPFLIVLGGVGAIAWLTLRRIRRGRAQSANPPMSV
jgi:hypothetical protein